MKMWGLLTSILLVVAIAFAQPKTRSFQTATILSVQRQEANGVSYRKTDDAPLKSTVFTYDVSVKMDDTVLVGRYENPIDYLPWAVGSSVQVSADKHRMYLKGPSSEEFELSIVSRRPVHKGK